LFDDFYAVSVDGCADRGAEIILVAAVDLSGTLLG